MYDTLKIALGVGVKYNEFWELTPFELELIWEDFNDKKQEEIEKLVITTWKAGYYNRLAWTAKTYPKLDDELEKVKKKETVEDMTDEQLLNQVIALNAIFGGVVNE